MTLWQTFHTFTFTEITFEGSNAGHFHESGTKPSCQVTAMMSQMHSKPKIKIDSQTQSNLYDLVASKRTQATAGNGKTAEGEDDSFCDAAKGDFHRPDHDDNDHDDNDHGDYRFPTG